MKLYVTAGAPNPRRVEIFLREKQIEVETVEVSLGRLEHRSSDYAKLNPMRQIPTLQFDDGTTLTESVAICRYFEEIQPAPPLLGTGARQRAEVEMWQRRLEMGLLLPVASVFRHSHPFMKDMEVPQVPEWADANRPRVAAFLEMLDGILANRAFVTGDTFTIADITGIVTLEFMRPARLKIDPALAHVARWHQAIASRPSALMGAKP